MFGLAMLVLSTFSQTLQPEVLMSKQKRFLMLRIKVRQSAPEPWLKVTPAASARRRCKSF